MLENFSNLIKNTIGEGVIKDSFATDWEHGFYIVPEKLKKVCLLLRDNEQCYFDMLSCVTGIDNLPEENTLELIYNLHSLPFNDSISLKVKLDRDDEILPTIDSLVDIWASANWLEREVYDLIGIYFEGHPDLRRILLPTDWKGHPLRKDYKLQEYYHGVKVEY